MRTLRAMPVLDVAHVRAPAVHHSRPGFDCHGFRGVSPVDFAIARRGRSVCICADDIEALPALKDRPARRCA